MTCLLAIGLPDVLHLWKATEEFFAALSPFLAAGALWWAGHKSGRAAQASEITNLALTAVKNSVVAVKENVLAVKEDGDARSAAVEEIKATVAKVEAKAEEHADKLETVRLDVNDKLQQFLRSNAEANYQKGLKDAGKSPSNRTGADLPPEPRTITHPGDNPTPQK